MHRRGEDPGGEFALQDGLRQRHDRPVEPQVNGGDRARLQRGKGAELRHLLGKFPGQQRGDMMPRHGEDDGIEAQADPSANTTFSEDSASASASTHITRLPRRIATPSSFSRPPARWSSNSPPGALRQKHLIPPPGHKKTFRKNLSGDGRRDEIDRFAQRRVCTTADQKQWITRSDWPCRAAVAES